ncbi:BppU family phage baseplate upper protein [Lactococcus petauri]|uniref:BppU family phage baseplate upper protein n=1 Tax=Lactococcus petauri TaxID=1940789 RepID=UPI001FB031BF|nr:BppU family phage baseplate upper protein [Lactococcus petauri]
MAYKTLNLDLAKSPILKSIVYGRIGDSDMQTVTVNVTSRDVPVDLTGFIITFEGITNGEKTKVFDVDGISSTPEGLKKGTFDYTFPNMAFAVGGSYEIAYFSIVKGDKRDTTGEFDIIVGSNADIDAAEAETIITEYNKLVKELHAITDKYISDSDAKFAAINAKIVDLQAKITQYQTTVKNTADSAVSTINTTKDSAINAVNASSNAAIKAVDDALKKFESGNFYTKSESDAKFKVVNDLIISQDIPEGANLDDYKKEGEFSKKTPTVVTGAPEGVTGAFRLSVRSMVGSSGIFQTLYDYATRAIYYRIGNTTLGFNLTWQRIANNSEVVHLAGDETIEGKKTFTGSLEAQLLSSDGTPLRTATFDADGQALSTDRELTPLTMASGFTANAAEYCIKGRWIFITVQGARPTSNQTGSSYYTFLKLPSEIVKHLSHTEAFMWSNFQGGGAAYSGGILNTGDVQLYASPSSVTIGSNHRYSFNMVIPLRKT